MTKKSIKEAKTVDLPGQPFFPHCAEAERSQKGSVMVAGQELLLARTHGRPDTELARALLTAEEGR